MKRKRNPTQLELPRSSDFFNLAPESGADPVRVTLDQLHAEARLQAARDYERKMQRTFEDCPGFQGGIAPSSAQAHGWLVVSADKIQEAMPWMRRRFIVNESVTVDKSGLGLRVEFAPIMRRPGMKQPRKAKVKFTPPEQYNLPL